MNSYLYIFPTTLLNMNKDFFKKFSKIIIIEHPFYFTRLKFHKQKVLLHRASMIEYMKYLESKTDKSKVKYIEYNRFDSKKYGKGMISIFDPIDKDIKRDLVKNNKDIMFLSNEVFLFTKADLDEFHESVKDFKKISHSKFYKWSLEKLQLNNMIERSYDADNRKSYKGNDVVFKVENKLGKNIEDAKRYVDKGFNKNVGDMDTFIYPVNFKEAKDWLKRFIKYRLLHYGDYQDSINHGDPFLYHSVLSSSLNIGLLTPSYVLEKVVGFYKKNMKKVKINNFEGFVRQLIGWREYMKYIYEFHEKELLSSNFLNLNEKLPKSWYDGTTDIMPIDLTIKQTLKYGYMNHIQRLMVVLNSMILHEIRSDDIYRWFMIMSIDSYDWVMVSNIYAMGFFSNKFMSRPYISSSNYLIKMMNIRKRDSDYNNHKKWIDYWDKSYDLFLAKKKNKEKIKILNFYS